MENVIDDCSVANEERTSLITLKRRQDEVFNDEEKIDLDTMIRECQMNNVLGKLITGTLTRNIFNLRNNYLKLRIRSKFEENYLMQLRSSGEEDVNVSETYMDFLRSNNVKIDLEITINYPDEYPFVRPNWEINKYHGINIDENIKYYFDEKVNNHNILNERSWSAVIDLASDIKKFLVSVGNIWNLLNI